MEGEPLLQTREDPFGTVTAVCLASTRWGKTVSFPSNPRRDVMFGLVVRWHERVLEKRRRGKSLSSPRPLVCVPVPPCSVRSAMPRWGEKWKTRTRVCKYVRAYKEEMRLCIPVDIYTCVYPQKGEIMHLLKIGRASEPIQKVCTRAKLPLNVIAGYCKPVFGTY